jgi:dipeptidyl aminopeptidase/acylaminoacyl peptidase
MQKAITGIQWRPGSDEVVFTVTDPDMGLAQSIFRWNVGNGAVHQVVASQGLLSGGRDSSSGCGVSAEALVCVAADAGRPPRLERIDLETGDRRILFDPNAALAQDMARAVPVRLLHWTDTAGRPVTGQFYPARKTGDHPSPLFVSYYRCDGFVRGAYGDEWPLASLAAHGISALCINDSATRVDAVERYDRGRQAVEGAIDMLAAAGEIDRTKVGMGGLSFGTEVTLWTVIHSDLIAAASISSVAVSQQYYLLGSMKGDVFFSGLRDYWQLGAPNETPERWKVLSPALNLEKIRCPILMQVPEQEYMLSLDYAIPLMRAHRADLYVFPHEPHQKFQPKHKLAVYERNLDWFRFWLQGSEDPNPAKAEQYARWQLMRANSSAQPVH